METPAEQGLLPSTDQSIRPESTKEDVVSPWLDTAPPTGETTTTPPYNGDQTAALTSSTYEASKVVEPITHDSIAEQVPRLSRDALWCIACRNSLRTCACRPVQTFQPTPTKDDTLSVTEDSILPVRAPSAVVSDFEYDTTAATSSTAHHAQYQYCVVCHKDSFPCRIRRCCSKPVCSNCMVHLASPATSSHDVVFATCPNTECRCVIPYTIAEFYQMIVGVDVDNSLDSDTIPFAYWPRSELPCVACGSTPPDSTCVLTPCCTGPVCSDCIWTRSVDYRQKSFLDIEYRCPPKMQAAQQGIKHY